MDPIELKPLTILAPPADPDLLAEIQRVLAEQGGARLIVVEPDNALDIDAVLTRAMAGEERVTLLDPEAVTAALRGLVYPPKEPADVAIAESVDSAWRRLPMVAGAKRLPSLTMIKALTGVESSLPPPRPSPVLATLAALSSLAGPGAMMPEDRRLFRRPERTPPPPREVQEAIVNKAARRKERLAKRNLAAVRSGGMAAR